MTDILTNPLYTGHICSETYSINWLKGQHGPLIFIDVYDSVQELRDGKPKLRLRKNIEEDFALRGFVICGDCGTLLRRSLSKGRHKSYAYYLCPAKGCANHGQSIARDTLKGGIGNLIKTLQPTENLLD